MRRPEKVAQLVDQDLQPLRFADLTGRFANEDVRGQFAVRAAQVHFAANPLVVARKTNRHSRRERTHLLGELQQRLVEGVDGRVRIPMAHLDDFEPHAAMMFEDVGCLRQPLADPFFPDSRGLGVVKSSRIATGIL